jgi:hypothetical protein
MILRVPITIVLSLFMFPASSQSRSEKKQCRKLVAEARFATENEEYYKAWTLYRNALALDPMNEQAGVGGAATLFRLRYPVDSAKVFEANLSRSEAAGAKYYLARIRHQQRAFDEALTLLNDYLRTPVSKRVHATEEIMYLLERCRNASAFISNPSGAVIRNMGPAINSKYQDYVPVIITDESALYFTSKRENPEHPRRNGDKSFFEDVYVSYKADGKWKPAESVGDPINSETNDGCVAISPDGQRMIVFRTASDVVTGDLYITRRGKKNSWEPLQKMSAEINSPFVETSACFSTDTSDIYFSSDRPGGLGGKDLYRIRRLPNGRWSVPMNLGSNVNTPYDDDAPFLHPDGVTLYFSSKGHNSMGEFDVFRSVQNEERTSFGPSENLGYPINDVGNDIFFVLSVDGQRGYYSSEKAEALGDIDIYEIDTRFGDNDLKVRQGYTFLDGKPGQARVTLVEAGTGQLNGTYSSHPDNGRFIVVVNPLKKYLVTVESEGHQTIETVLQPIAFEMTEELLNFTLKKEDAQ